MGLKGPLPFIVAVTGHRDLREADAPTVAARVRGLLTELRDTYPETELKLLTPLAEGADRLAARVALGLGIPIIAVLPLDPEEYKKDFAAADSKSEFDALLQQASGRVVLPPPPDAELRPESYVAVAAYVVQHCHVLVALWDGVNPGKRGGTSEVVRACLQGPEPRYVRASRMLDPQETGLVFHIFTPRKDSRLANAGDSRWLMPGGGDEKAARAALEQLAESTNDFNRGALDRSPAAIARRAKWEGYLVGDAGALAPGLQRVASLFAIADDLAIHTQRMARLGVIAIFVLAFLAILFFEAVTEDVDVSRWFVGLLIAAHALYRVLKWRRFDSRHLDYRSLAEALRVQFYWRVAGIGGSISPNFMRYHLKESEWIRKAILAGDLHDDIAGGETLAAPADGLQFAVKHWVKGQNAFFERAQARDQRQLGRINIAARIAGWLGTATVVVFLTLWWRGALFADSAQISKTLLVLAIALLAGGGAALQGYADKRALEAQARRYARMRGIFQSALRMLERPGQDAARSREVLRELGKEALVENADWVMLHRDRPLEAPRGPGG